MSCTLLSIYIYHSGVHHRRGTLLMEIYRDIQPTVVSIRDYTYIPKVEGTFTLPHGEWLVEDTQGVRLEGIMGDHSEVIINGELRGIFRPHSDTSKVKVTSSLVWGCQTYYMEYLGGLSIPRGEWVEDIHIDHKYSQYVGDIHYYATQRRVWKAVIL